MSPRRRVLVATRKSDFASTTHRELSRLPEWRLIGIIDPRVEDAFEQTCVMADAVVIEAEDLIWLWRNRWDATQELLKNLHVATVLSDTQILDIIPNLPGKSGLLFRGANGEVPLERLELALKGYMSIPESLLDGLKQNRMRQDIVAGFSAEELHILSYLRSGMSNQKISIATGLAENRIKTLVHLVTHKLRLKNRTAVAMFVIQSFPASGISD